MKGYPTLYFISASGKLSEYDGDRTKEAIIDFIEKSRDKYITPQDSPKDEKSRDETTTPHDSPKDEL